MNQIKIVTNFMDKSLKEDILKLQKKLKSNPGDFSKDSNKYKIPEKDNSNFFNKGIIPLSELKKEKKFFSNLAKTRNHSQKLKVNSFNNRSNKLKQSLQNNHWNFRIKPSSIYSILAMKKDELIDEYNGNYHYHYPFYSQKKQKPKKKKISNILNVLNNNTNNNSLINEEKDKNEKEFDNYLNMPQIYISNFHGDLLNSEKLRYKSIMEKLTLLRNYIKEKPSQAKDIIKKFLINNGLYNPNFISENKIKNFLYFIRENFDVDPSKTFHENLLNILNGKYHKISKKEQTPKKAELSTIEKQGKFIFPKKSTYKFRKYLEHINKDYRYKNESIKWELDLRRNLNRQKEVCLPKNNKVFDIVNQPEKLIDELENEIYGEKHFIDDAFAKTFIGWNKKNKNFELKLGSLDVIDRNCNVDVQQLKKNNLLTEYVCLVKAKKNCIDKEITKQYNLL